MSKRLDYTTVMVGGRTYSLTVDRRPPNASHDLRREVRLQSSHVIGHVEQRKDRKWYSYPIGAAAGLSTTRNEALGHLVAWAIKETA